ncbi:hypothetical protein BDBG_17279 [Blastomyces gilchristii SLH14081]|uniref:Uncharacterized protein n=2 Tax=Blastomyces TaxID=229219 RepID=A0A179UPE3_BLAGS|nr:uncharacterized protein BDBG_17279 [Blastomyces gilchristii SLH14081]EGE77846.2 hypothetical protein BDDG_00783 [Blastomyces dermatitidis ATCC 18188]OAT09874.1 hypothetical protein BDBG_17279 [Blastomyces gilchristii SLH14081]
MENGQKFETNASPVRGILYVKTVGGPGLIGPSTSSALVVIELFCPSSLQVMRLLSVSPAVVNMHGFDPRMDLRKSQTNTLDF